MVTLPGSVVDAAWLAEHLGQVVLADVRWYLDDRSGRAAYHGGHLPTAVFVDLDTDLSAPAGPSGRHPLPSPEAFAAAMSALGIDDATPVVAYDDAGGVVAARLWWMLHVLGHPVAVLDGGIGGWTDRLVTHEPAITPAAFTVRPWPADRFVEADDLDVGSSPGRIVLDARSADRYDGQEHPVDPRFGHIPGAQSAPAGANLDPTTGALASLDDLRGRYQRLGALDADEVVAYCGSGVSACHDLLVLERLGRTNTRLYVGSWSEWAANPDRPVVT